MRKKVILAHFVLLLLVGFLDPAGTVRANPPQSNAPQARNVTPSDLILAMNTLRVSLGHPALIEHPIINAVAQATAETMAANNMSWHIGNVRGRIQAAGYGGGATVWATENFAVGTSMGIDQIMAAWADSEHMRPAANPAYCHIGAGKARAANGRTYYILQAAYVSGKACGDISSNEGTTGGNLPVPQFIVPVKIATQDAEGKIYHEVKTGQSFWAIAIAYQITIADLEYWNNLSRDQKLQIGQRLFIPSAGTEGYATPTPVGMVVPSPPDKDGKIVHTVEAYQTLSTIAQAYQVSMDTLLNLNGIQIDWPLQIGQKLLVSPGIVLSPLERLTPNSDGNYFHTVQSGETLSEIARLYEISLDNLMAWNGLNENSIIRPGQSLFLPVTPPATRTPTPNPPTAQVALAATLTPTQPPPTPTQTQTPAALSPTAPAGSVPHPVDLMKLWPLPVALISAGVIFLVWISRRKPSEEEGSGEADSLVIQMKIMVFLHGTTIMHKQAVGRTREEVVRQILERRDVSLYDFGSYVPVGEAVRKLHAWRKQGAEIVYLSSHRKAEDVDIDGAVLRNHHFPDGLILYRQSGEQYKDVAERVLPDILIEDDCESIGGEKEMTYPHIKSELKARIKSIVVKEFGGIDHLPDDISALKNV